MQRGLTIQMSSTDNEIGPCGSRSECAHTWRVLLLGDGSGSNCATQYRFTEALQRLTKRLGLEHRVIPHLTRAGQRVIFHSWELGQQFSARAKTSRGLGVTERMLEQV